MSKQQKKNSNWTVEWVKVLRSERVDKKNRIDLRIIKWERSLTPVLEKRRVWEKEEGDVPTKLVGLSASDVKYVYENYADIINDL